MFLPDLVVRSRRVVTPRGTQPAAIHIRSGRVIGIVDFDDVPPGCPLDDRSGAVVMPGIVDTNVHVNRPGGDDPSGFEATTRAAAAGGVTTIVDMPDTPPSCIPPTTTVSALESKRRIAQGACFVDVGFWGGVVPGNTRDLRPLVEAGVLGFKCTLLLSVAGEFPPVSEADLRIVMPALTSIGATLLAHAELAGPIDSALARQRVERRWVVRLPWRSPTTRRYAAYLETHPKQAENDAVALLIQLCGEHRTRTHITHLSSSDTLTPLFRARAARLPMTAETCPHYLFFVAEEMLDVAAALRCAPPIRERANRELLWAALANGLIQTVASDFTTSLQLSLPVMWTVARDRGYTLDQIANWMSRAPSQLAGLDRKGKIDVGYDADLVVFDPDAEFTVKAASLEHRHRVTPYFGGRLRGVVERTYLRGRQIYDRGQAVWSPPYGKFLVPSAG